MQRVLLGFCGAVALYAVPWPGAFERALPFAVSLLALGWACVSWRDRAGRRASSWPAAVSAGAVLGALWGALWHADALSARLDRDTESTLPLCLVGPLEPVSVGSGRPPAQRFRARVAAELARAEVPAARPLRLTWYDPPAGLAKGQCWSAEVVLKRPWGYANPAGFDYERWLLGKGLSGTGWVRGGRRLVSAPARGWLDRVRERLAAEVRARTLAHPGILLALLLGRSDDIGESTWRVLRATGTVHLMVISGLHVSLAAAVGLLAGRWLCRLFPPLLLWLDARRAGCLLGAATAAAYTALSATGLPAWRAALTSLAMLLLLSGSRTRHPGAVLVFAVFLLLLWQPLAVHQAGFQLSCASLGLLLVARVHGRGRSASAFAAQAGLSLVLLPWIGLVTGNLPWTGIPANLLAVPVTTLVTVPATLLGGLLALGWPWGADVALQLADAATGVVLTWLRWLATAAPATPAGPGVALVTAQCAALWWASGMQRRHLPVALLGCLLPLLPPSPRLAPGEYRISALDVGQGTAVIVDTEHHRLLYDAGPAFAGGFDTGAAVVVPSLAATGPLRLDALVLSHDDIDHTGGAPSVRAAAPPRQVLTALPKGDARHCDGRHWSWDGVRFEFMAPPRPADASDNDRSCVLLVDDGRHATLLTGDISRRIESALLRPLANAPRGIHLLFAPHHGSATSSGRALVRVARARLVFVSAGHANRFGHPHPEVVRRYRGAGAALFQTGRAGALIWRSGEPLRVVRWRLDRAPYWRAQDAAASRR